MTIEKIEMRTANKIDENIEKLRAIFPNCITEKEDENGELKKVVNFKILQQMLTEDAIADPEAYEFTWVGKNAAIVEANRSIEKTLRPCKEESVDWEKTENLYIEGENLATLKLLQKAYLGKIKVIYIDPPYNTGDDLLYLDKRVCDLKTYETKSRLKDEANNILYKNKDTRGRFHSDWCSMIYSRLLVARDLLAEDGVIFISIDDSELQNLINICDEIFGESNRIANLVATSNSSKNNSTTISTIHDYLICYAKCISKVPLNWKIKRNNSEEYKKRAKQLVKSKATSESIHKELLNLSKYPRFYDFDHFVYADKTGIYQTSDLTAPDSQNFYDIIHPVTQKKCSIGTRGWAYSYTTMQELLKNDKIHFGDDETTIPRLKNYLFEDDNELMVPKSVVFFDSQGSTKWMKNEKFYMDYPKAIDYIKHIISLYPNKEITILDFFSGSGTTAHAVMQLNAENNGTLKYILVQIPELCDKSSKAYKAGYNTIAEIGKERIRRAGEQIKAEYPLIDIDIGFRVLKLDDWNKKDVMRIPSELRQTDLDEFDDATKDDRTDLDLLFGCLIEEGVELTKQINEKIIDGIAIQNYNDGWLIGCFADNVPESVIRKIAELKPRKVVFKDSSFQDSPAKINVTEIFKMISPDTTIKVI